MLPNVIAPANAAPATVSTPDADPLRAVPKVVPLPEGIYFITARLSANIRQQIKGVGFPCAQLSSLPEPGHKPLQFLTRDGLAASAWLTGTEGVTVVVTPESATLLVTTLTLTGQLSSCLNVSIQRLGDETVPANVDLQVTAHIQRLGDRTFSSGEWASAGDHLFWIESFTINGSPELADGLEYCSVNPTDPSGTWVKPGTLSGTRRQGMPLLGAGFRLGSALAATHKVHYTVRFLRHGDVDGSDGSVCRSSQPQDPVMALKVAVLPR